MTAEIRPDAEPQDPPFTRFRSAVRRLYFGSSVRSRRWRVGLLAFDFVAIAYFFASILFGLNGTDHRLDYLIGAVMLADYLLRLAAANRPLKAMVGFMALADAVVIVSLFASAVVEGLAMLLVVRLLRLLRSYHLIRELQGHMPFFRRNEQVIQALVNLTVFIFVVSAAVHVLEQGRNPHINSYLDALYYTVSTLTTTGFGDITMTDTYGRMLTILIMIVGVGLFLRLVQTIFRPLKVIHKCPECGLNRHDPDAVHCKHCGIALNIPTEGDWR